MHPLLTFAFWFSLSAIPFTRVADALLLYGDVALIVAGAVCLACVTRLPLEKDLRKPVRSFCALLIWFGVVGLILYAFTWLRIPILSMRFFLLLWIGAYAAWGWNIWRRIFVIRPTQRQEAAAREAYEKWLPRPKHRR